MFTFHKDPSYSCSANQVVNALRIVFILKYLHSSPGHPSKAWPSRFFPCKALETPSSASLASAGTAITASHNALSSSFRTSPGVPTSTQALLLQVFPVPQPEQVTTLPQPSFAFPHFPEQASGLGIH